MLSNCCFCFIRNVQLHYMEKVSKYANFNVSMWATVIAGGITFLGCTSSSYECNISGTSLKL